MDAPTWGGKIRRQELQQAIRELHRVNEVPRLPAENLPVPGLKTKHILSIEREEAITSNLAFLSATTDDTLKVMAVCIEEHDHGEGITIRLATNTGDLVVITSEFDILARILERAAQRENTRSEDTTALYQHVIRMDFCRILSRLRSCHAKMSMKTAGKSAIITQLWEALKAKPVTANSISHECKNRARNLKELFEKLENIPDLSLNKAKAERILEDIVQQAHELTQSVNLSNVLRKLRLDPSLKAHLPNAIGKLGRYYSASCELISAARDKNCRVFKNVTVKPFQIQIPTSLQSSKQKVHAEIQLLFFYELHPNQLRPRAICSSKSACFLCNLFFNAHGLFHIPRTHGKLYRQWMLPTWLEIPKERHAALRQAVASMKTTLDREIRQGVKAGKMRYSHPNESVLLPLGHWSPSVLSACQSSNKSTSTIRPALSVTRDRSPLQVPSPCAELPLTPPRTPPDETFPTHNEIETETDTEKAVDHAPIVANIPIPIPAIVSPSVSSISLIHDDLPYTQLVTLISPLLHLQLDKLSMTFEFIAVSSGRLSITQTQTAIEDDKSLMCEGIRTVDVQDIPTTTEMRECCPEDSNEVTFALCSAKRGVIIVKFIWDE